MDKICIQELVKRLTEDYIPSGVEMIDVLERTEFQRGKIAGVAMVIDSLERLVEDLNRE
jgi:hypothetical protein